MTEFEWDKKLKINTIGRDDSHADTFHHPYEPTPYVVLERLAESGYIGKENVVIDYGCGKGRVGFYLRHAVGCRVIGLEYDEKIYGQALENLQSYVAKAGVEFRCENAEKYEVSEGDCYYFFNPFPVEILKCVMRRIVDSYYENPRRMQFFFYYPDDAYMSYLLAGDQSGLLSELYFVDEIDCGDLFPGGDEREKIVVFEIG